MGIYLDWQVDSDSGRDSIEEDAAVIAEQHRRRRRSRVTVMLAAAVLLLIAAIAGYRYKIVHDEKLRTLQATIEAESLALRLGDKAKFMSFQGSADAWRAEQRAAFEAIQALGVAVEVTGRVLDQTVTEHEAEVIVEIIVNDTPYQVVWLYQYTDEGWKHTDTREEPWTEQTVTHDPFTYTYSMIHQPMINQLDGLLTDWWATVEQDTGQDKRLEIAIVIDPEADGVDWTNREQTTLVIPSHAAGQADLASPEDSLRLELAEIMADRWSDALMLEDRHGIYDLWARDQIELWFERRFGILDGKPSIFVYLTGTGGPDLLSDFITTWYAEKDGYAALQQVVTADIPQNPTYQDFEHFLNLVVALNATTDGMMDSNVRSGSLFFEVDERAVSAAFSHEWMYYRAQAGSFHVESTEQIGNVLWLTVSFQQDQAWYGAGEDDPRLVTATALIPFRNLGSSWRLALLRPEDWGAPVIEQGDGVTFTYYEIDAETYGNLLPALEDAVRQAKADLNLTDLPPFHVEIMTDPSIWQIPEPTTTLIQMSPHRLSCCAFEGLDWQAFVEYSLITSVYNQIFYRVAGERSGFPTHNVEWAMLNWAYKRHGWQFPVIAPSTEPVAVAGVPVPDSWQIIWRGTDTVSDEKTIYRSTLENLGVRVMVETIIDTYGEDAYPLLVQNVYAAGSADEWLELSLGLDEDERRQLEDEWRDRFYAAVREQFGDAAFAQE